MSQPEGPLRQDTEQKDEEAALHSHRASQFLQRNVKSKTFVRSNQRLSLLHD